MKKKTITKHKKVDKRRPIYWSDLGKGLLAILIISMGVGSAYIMYSAIDTFFNYIVSIITVIVIMSLSLYSLVQLAESVKK